MFSQHEAEEEKLDTQNQTLPGPTKREILERAELTSSWQRKPVGGFWGWGAGTGPEGPFPGDGNSLDLDCAAARHPGVGALKRPLNWKEKNHRHQIKHLKRGRFIVCKFHLGTCDF